MSYHGPVFAALPFAGGRVVNLVESVAPSSDFTTPLLIAPDLCVCVRFEFLLLRTVALMFNATSTQQLTSANVGRRCVFINKHGSLRDVHADAEQFALVLPLLDAYIHNLARASADVFARTHNKNEKLCSVCVTRQLVPYNQHVPLATSAAMQVLASPATYGTSCFCLQLCDVIACMVYFAVEVFGSRTMYINVSNPRGEVFGRIRTERVVQIMRSMCTPLTMTRLELLHTQFMQALTMCVLPHSRFFASCNEARMCMQAAMTDLTSGTHLTSHPYDHLLCALDLFISEMACLREDLFLMQSVLVGEVSRLRNAYEKQFPQRYVAPFFMDMTVVRRCFANDPVCAQARCSDTLILPEPQTHELMIFELTL